MNNSTKIVAFWLQTDEHRAEGLAAAKALLADRRRNTLESATFKACFPNAREGITPMAEMLVKAALIQVDWLDAARAIIAAERISL